jgi:hypothetical protein
MIFFCDHVIVPQAFFRSETAGWPIPAEETFSQGFSGSGGDFSCR